MSLNLHWRVEQAAPDARRDRRACTRAACKRFARATFENAQLHRATAHDLHETRVHPLRKARVMFDNRPFGQHGRIFHVGHDLNGVRIAH